MRFKGNQSTQKQQQKHDYERPIESNDAVSPDEVFTLPNGEHSLPLTVSHSKVEEIVTHTPKKRQATITVA